MMSTGKIYHASVALLILAATPAMAMASRRSQTHN